MSQPDSTCPHCGGSLTDRGSEPERFVTFDFAWRGAQRAAAFSIGEAVRTYIGAFTDKEGKVRVARVHDALKRQTELYRQRDHYRRT